MYRNLSQSYFNCENSISAGTSGAETALSLVIQGFCYGEKSAVQNVGRNLVPRLQKGDSTVVVGIR